MTHALETANFSLTSMGKKRTLDARLIDYNLAYNEFGVTGDGVTDDTVALQAFLVYAFGTGRAEANAYLHKPVYLPAGNFKISAPLHLDDVHGARIIGAGSHRTRIFWDPSAPEVVGATSTSSLFEFRTVQYIIMEGITLDASNVQDAVLRLWSFYPLLIEPTGGSGGKYHDMHFTNAGTGVMGGFPNASLCSEQVFTKCRFTNCSDYGVSTATQNALNYNFFSCYIANCGTGYRSPAGGSGVIRGNWFHNNKLDIRCAQAMTTIEGNYSTSRHFASAGGLLIGNTHVNATPGAFLVCSGSTLPADGISGPPWYETGTDTNKFVLVGNYSTNGYLADTSGGSYITLIGNKFDNPSYLAGLDVTVGAGVVNLWEDGVHTVI